jgi:CMP-N-acetylneuraminic acid synthetase
MNIAILPMRRGSERVPQKNTRPFAGIAGGLARIKLAQLLDCAAIDLVIITTDDPLILENASEWAGMHRGRLQLNDRPERLARSETTTDELIEHVMEELIRSFNDSEVILWTHATSPFFQSQDYKRAIDIYYEKLGRGRFDSLMTVRRVQEFVWSDTGPINYDRSIMRWPRTQSLTPLWWIDSAIFLARARTYRTENDRIGRAPYLLETGWPQTLDVDTLEDFNFAELLWRQGIGSEGRPQGISEDDCKHHRHSYPRGESDCSGSAAASS